MSKKEQLCWEREQAHIFEKYLCVVSVQLNQIAKVANSTQSVYAKDVEDMRKQMDYFRTVMENYLTELKPELI